MAGNARQAWGAALTAAAGAVPQYNQLKQQAIVNALQQRQQTAEEDYRSKMLGQQQAQLQFQKDEAASTGLDKDFGQDFQTYLNQPPGSAVDHPEAMSAKGRALLTAEGTSLPSTQFGAGAALPGSDDAAASGTPLQETSSAAVPDGRTVWRPNETARIASQNYLGQAKLEQGIQLMNLRNHWVTAGNTLRQQLAAYHETQANGRNAVNNNIDLQRIQAQIDIADKNRDSITDRLNETAFRNDIADTNLMTNPMIDPSQIPQRLATPRYTAPAVGNITGARRAPVAPAVDTASKWITGKDGNPVLNPNFKGR